MRDKLRFILNRLAERLWVRPLVMGLISLGAALFARSADSLGIGDWVPEIKAESINNLLQIMASSMLVIATFAVASMVSAYASASSSATPRSFSLIVADDVSQNALSAFLGAFIFSIVALVAFQNDYFDKAGRFALFALTLTVFAIVIVTFVRWVDRIARLGRMSATVDKVENAAANALTARRQNPLLGGRPQPKEIDNDAPEIHAKSIGYVVRIDMDALQVAADACDLQVTILALQGTFVTPDRPLAVLDRRPSADTCERLAEAFVISADRVFDEDPRFGVIVLAEIASRALSPAVNDAGTAIDIIGTQVRLLAAFSRPPDSDSEEGPEVRYDRITVPELSWDDLLDDAFISIGRDGAGCVEVAVRLQKALQALANLGNDSLREAALRHSSLAIERCRKAMVIDADLNAVTAAAPSF